LNFVIALTVVAAVVFQIWHRTILQAHIEKEFPVAAVDYIRDHHLKGPIFNAYEWGGYIIWRLYPQYLVFIDGRSDLYGDQFLKEFVNIYLGRAEWQPVFKRYGIRTAILHHDSPLAISLRHAPEYRIAFEDPQAVVFIANESP
jgi:hypothetical protein